MAKMEKIMKKRIVYIDALKGLAMLLVLVAHVLPENTAVKNLIYLFHMPLFFFLSNCLLNVENSFC